MKKTLSLMGASYLAGVATLYVAGPWIGARLQTSGNRLIAMELGSQVQRELAPVVVRYESPSAGKPIAKTWGAR